MEICRLLLSGWLLLCSGLVTGNAASFLPTNAVVVLLAGLPGDVENENAYLQQMQSWLEILADGPARPEQIYAFFDTPGAVKPANSPAVKVAKASREEFLALGNSLAGKTNALVVIAWGHGGMQGSTPVFHVRGPRLTPADFKSFAAPVPSAESQWVLFFRGSGRFARELAAPRREVVSSEQETIFSSDPIALPVLLRLARSKPAATFAELADELGRGVSAWYEERSLARTEEPTFWQADQPPRRLVSPEAESGLLAEKKEKPATPATAKETPRPVVPLTEPAEAEELPAVWKEITRVEPQKYPDADAVVLRRRVSYTLGSSPAIAMDHEEFIQILTAEGKHFGDFDITYSPMEDISFLDCEVLRADGKRIRLDPEAIREGREDPLGDYQVNRRKFFSLPGVGPGTVVHVRYKTEWKKYPLPHISLEIPIGAEVPVREATLEVSVPKDSAFHFKLEHATAADPELKQAAYGSTYTWRFQNLPGHEHEALSPPGQQARLLVSTFPDWAAFAEWYARISKLTDEVTPEIAAKAKELTRDAQTDREKVIALYNYVTGLRYVMVPLGVNSHRPHAAANVLQNQFGDCKDKANLFNTLLHSLDLDARLVLVPRLTQAYEALPGLAFNHAISRVQLGGETLWVDTTDDVCRFGMLPPGDPGRKVLVIDGQTTTLTQLPLPEVKDHRLEIRACLDLRSATNAVPTEIEATATGSPDYELRLVAREANAHRSTVPLLAAKFRPVCGVFAVESQRSTAASALTENFTWKANGTSVGAVTASNGRWLIRAPFWLPREWELALSQRKTPLLLQQGYPLQLEENFEFRLPVGAENVSVPRAIEGAGGPLRWKIEWAKDGAAPLRAQLRIELSRGELAVGETGAVQQQLRDLLSACAAAAAFELSQ